MIIATQTPRKDVISGVIKANFPTQIAFRVGNGIDSKVILDSTGAEKLLGNGDMLFSQGARIERVQCGYIDADEIYSLALAVESQKGFQKASTSYLQTNLGMGFARAARVMQQLEAAGIVGHQDGAKSREVLVKDFAELDPILKSFGCK